MNSRQKPITQPGIESYFTRSKASLFQGDLTKHFEHTLKVIRDLPSRVALTEKTMSLETPEDSMAAAAANVAEQTAQNEITKQITSVGDAAAALISLADGQGAMNAQASRQQAVMSTATTTVSSVHSAVKPAFNFNRKNTPSRSYGGARPKSTWPTDTSEGYIDDTPGQLGLQPLKTGMQALKHPDRQPGDELREARKKAQTMEELYLEIQRERDQLRLKSQRDNQMQQTMVKDRADLVTELENLKKQLAAQNVAQLSPAIQVGMADSMRLQQAVADGKTLQIQGGAKGTTYEPLQVVVTSQSAPAVHVAQPSPQILQQDVLMTPVAQTRQTLQTQAKTDDLSGSITKLNQQGYAVIRMPHPGTIVHNADLANALNTASKVRFNPIVSQSRMSTPRNKLAWETSPAVQGYQPAQTGWLDHSFQTQQAYLLNEQYQKDLLAKMAVGLQPPVTQQGYVPPITMTQAPTVQRVQTPPPLTPVGEVPEQLSQARDRVSQPINTANNRKNFHTILPKPYKSGDFIAFKEGFEQLSRINDWDDQTKTGQLVWCLQQGPAEIIVSSRPGHIWNYDELMQAGAEMFGCAISESKMRLELKQIKRKKDESLPDLTRRIINVSKRAFHMPEYRRFEEERTAFMNAVEDNRPLYYYLDRHQSTVTTLSGLLSLAMKYCNNEGASDDWVLSLVEKELESRGLAKKENDDKSASESINTSCKGKQDDKQDKINAFMFGDRHKPRSWEDGYKLITDRLNEDLSFRKQQHLDNKVAAQRQADMLEALKRTIENSKQAYVQQASKPYSYGPPQRGPRPNNHGWNQGYQPRPSRPRHQGNQTQHRQPYGGQPHRGNNNRQWQPRHQGQGYRPPRHQSSVNHYQEEYPEQWGAEDYYGYEDEQYYCYEACCAGDYSYDAPVSDNTSCKSGATQSSAISEPKPSDSE